MWVWVSFGIGLFLGMITGIFVIAMLKQSDPPERVPDYETVDMKDFLRAENFTECTLPMIPDSYQVGDTEDRSRVN